MEKTYEFSARYPIIGTDNFVEILMSKPEFMPPLTREELEQSQGRHSLSDAELADWVHRAADDTSKKVVWKITAPDYAQEGYTCGIDDLQALLLALQSIDFFIEDWEHATNSKCEYTYTVATKIVTQIPENK